MIKASVVGLLAVCLMQWACSNPRQPDLSSLESPGNADSCAAKVSVGSGIVHTLAVLDGAEPTTACAVARATLQPLSSKPDSERPQEIRGTMRCSLIGHPGGAGSGKVYKVYVFADGSAGSAVSKVCDQLQAGADPAFDFQTY